MFTGLVEALGTVRDVRKAGRVFRLSIECPKIASELIYGQSVAVSGACLTVVAIRGDVFEVEMMPETAGRTRFASLQRGSRVNLERAMKLDGRLDGHLVLGHIDGKATLERLSGSETTKTAWFRAEEDVARYIVEKGSVAIDGVSLTVIGVSAAGGLGDSVFSVGLIPATLRDCTLGWIEPGDEVNVETDIIGKYVERLLRPKESGGGEQPAGGTAKTGRLTLEELSELGY
ncbi:MAG: riboflavin synthase [Synergistaceae bacterium]|jgi:riboflavin synthase|nr:riboflavin synthase [Synergistaceae bacterium]